MKPFLETLAARGFRPETLYRYRKAMEIFANCDFSVGRCLELMSKGSVQRRAQLQRIRSFLMFCGQTAEAEELPRFRSVEAAPKGAPSREEIQIVLGSFDVETPLGMRNRALLEILYSAAIRACEAVRLRIEDVDLAGKSLFVSGKGGRYRTAPFGREAGTWLKRYLEEGRPSLAPRGPRLFVGKWGAPLSADSIRQLLRKARKKLSFPRPITPHDLRRAAAGHCLEGGMPIREIQELLGHSKLESTVRYTALDRKKLGEMVEKNHPRKRMLVDRR